jgi:hypothetical protein
MERQGKSNTTESKQAWSGGEHTLHSKKRQNPSRALREQYQVLSQLQNHSSFVCLFVRRRVLGPTAQNLLFNFWTLCQDYTPPLFIYFNYLLAYRIKCFLACWFLYVFLALVDLLFILFYCLIGLSLFFITFLYVLFIYCLHYYLFY